MPRASIIQSNFTAGEISPRLKGRVDISRYQNGADLLENGQVLVHGGFKRRAGLRYVAKAKNNSTRCRLIPYVFNEDQAYIVELGDGYFRVYKNGALVLDSGGILPYEVATSFTEALLPDIDYAQGADTMFMTNVTLPTQRLKRFTDNNWTIGNVPFVTEPFDELGITASMDGTLSSAAVGSRTLTAASAVFLETDVGRDIYCLGGIGTITAYTSTTVVTVNVTTAFNSTALAANTWIIGQSPQCLCTPSIKDPVGGKIKLSLSIKTYGAEINISSQTRDESTVSVTTATPHGFSVGDLIRVQKVVPSTYNGEYTVRSAGFGGSTFTYTITSAPSADTVQGTVQLVTETKKDGWRSTDVGKLVRINSGLVKLVTYISADVFEGSIVQELAATTPAEALSWSLESTIWGGNYGYPRTVTLADQRLILAGSPGYPQTICGSVIGEYFNFELGTFDDDAYSFTIASDRFNPIAHITRVKSLIAMTYGGEFTLQGGIERPITPTNVQVKDQSVFGSGNVKPVRIGNELFFVDRSGRKIRALSADRYDASQFEAPDLSVLCEHITVSGIRELCFQQDPDPLLYALRNDGKIAALTVDRDQDVIAGQRIFTDGEIISAATIPRDGLDEVWVAVKRYIGGVPRINIERFDPDLSTDSAVTGSNPAGSTVWYVGPHLAGKTVDCLADGVDMGTFVVDAVTFQITLPRTAYEVEIGLNYITKIKTLTPEIAGQGGTAQISHMRIHEVTLRVLETIGGEVEGKVMKPRRLVPGNLDTAPVAFTGDISIENLGWEVGQASITITQSRPYPFHMLAVIYKFTWNDG